MFYKRVVQWTLFITEKILGPLQRFSKLRTPRSVGQCLVYWATGVSYIMVISGVSHFVERHFVYYNYNHLCLHYSAIYFAIWKSPKDCFKPVLSVLRLEVGAWDCFRQTAFSTKYRRSINKDTKTEFYRKWTYMVIFCKSQFCVLCWPKAN